MRQFWLGLGMLAVALTTPAAAQVRQIDPNQAIDSDLSPSSAPPPASTAPLDLPPADRPAPITPGYDPGYDSRTIQPAQPETLQQQAPAPSSPAPSSPAPSSSVPSTAEEARADATLDAADTYRREDLIAAGEGVFGKGAAGFAGIIEKILAGRGRPNAYIAGREAAGAFVVGLRYGSGVMTHKIEGQLPVYWTGPSIGFDVGGDANKVFVLVYNLYDTEDLFHRFPAAEGRLYLVGGFAATYLRWGNVVLIPVRLGVGYRAGVNIGYMNFSHKAKWLPF